jgi:hypothetical protein
VWVGGYPGADKSPHCRLAQQNHLDDMAAATIAHRSEQRVDRHADAGNEPGHRTGPIWRPAVMESLEVGDRPDPVGPYSFCERKSGIQPLMSVGSAPVYV